MAFAVWDDPSVDWAAFDAVVIRSTWDYPTRLPEFLAWLDRLPVPVHNPSEVLRTNADKCYLKALREAGVPTVPTLWLAPGARLGAAMAAVGWPEAVVKPVVSAGARETRRVRIEEALARDLCAPDEPCMLQPFWELVAERGEWSLLYFGGRYSHAVRKRPAPRDFRVQEMFGGVTTSERPPSRVRAAAEAVIAAAGPLAYARVDLFDTDEGPQVVEVELIEPCLFLGYDPLAPTRFAQALRALL